MVNGVMNIMKFKKIISFLLLILLITLLMGGILGIVLIVAMQHYGPWSNLAGFSLFLVIIIGILLTAQQNINELKKEEKENKDNE